MAVTAILLLLLAKGWQRWGNVAQIDCFWNPPQALLGCGVGLGISAVSMVLYSSWPTYRTSAETYLNLVLRPLILPDLIWLGLLPGLSEELLFRGVMLPSLGGNAIAVIVSATTFGLLHMSSRSQWPYALWATVVGLVFGSVTILTGNLLVPIVAHGLANILSALLWKRLQLTPSGKNDADS